MRNREEERSYVRVQVKCRIEDGDEIDMQIVDHSPNGIGAILASPVKIGTTIRVNVGIDRYQGVTKYCKQLERGGGRGYLVGLLLD